MAQGRLATAAAGNSIQDPTGLGRWSGFTLEGKKAQHLSVITAYRVCETAISISTMGSAYHREYHYYQEKGDIRPQPRKRFLEDLQEAIKQLQAKDHAVILMLDANATLDTDRHFRDMVNSLDLIDLHQADPAPSTFLGTPTRRIDYIFGCPRVNSVTKRQGTLSYTDGPQSDHRGLFIDVDLKQLFDLDLESVQLSDNELRPLRAGNPEHVAQYCERMHAYYEDHNMQERIDRLYKTHTTMSDEAVRRQLTSWDIDQGRAMAAAERHLRMKPKPHNWSPDLRNAAFLMRYWRMRLRELRCREDYEDSFDNWEHQIQEHDATFAFPQRGECLAIEQVRKEFNLATKAFRKVQSKSKELRYKSYHELLAHYDADDNPTTQPVSRKKAKIVNRTICGETRKRLFGAIRQIVNPSEYSPLSKIKVPRKKDDPNPTEPGQVHDLLKNNAPENLIWDTVISQKEIEEHLLKYNREAFRAAAESPCGKGVIHDALKFTSISQEAEELLQGIIPPEWHGDKSILREFLASFQIPETVLESEPLPTEVTSEDITRGFKGWKESTSTSPSGRHLGHYKAIIQDPILIESFRQFFNIAISRGISIPRWSNAVNVMIEKDKGNPCINRLQIIHLFEADYNLFLKLMWGSRLVRRALKLGLLHDGQHGSVPGRTTMDPIMLNQLTTDLCRVLRINYARFDNDASACFDRIIVALAMLAARRCGMPTNAVKTHATALELMQYTVKTVYGASEASYKGTPFEPLFGTGQGSGTSPAAWLTLVVLLLNTWEKVIPERICFRSPDGTMEHRRLVDAFVDDTALGITNHGDQSFEELVASLTKAAQTWEKLLFYSGGSLNLSKCSWYIMYWDWKQGRPILRKIQADDPVVTLHRGESNNQTQIKRLETNMSSRILGVIQTPEGDFSDHIAMLKAKADKYAGYLRSPRLSALDVKIFHQTMYGPAMRYSLPAVAVDEEELEQIQTKILPTIVQKLGHSSKLPTAIRHGPPEMGGIGLMDLRTEVGIEMIRFFRHSVYKQSQVGKLLLLSLQSSQLEAGIPTLLLEEPKTVVPYLTPTWILSMRQYMFNHNISITITDVKPPQLVSSTDEFIMSHSRLNDKYDVRAQKDINLVRIYLQATTIADLSDTADHRAISATSLNGIRSTDFIVNTGWPRQEQPSTSQIRLWTQYITSQFLSHNRTWKTCPYKAQRDQKPTETGTLDVITLIKHLPTFQRRMLTHVKQTASGEVIALACHQDTEVTIATDGGLKGRQGTFGWLISSNTNEILYEGAGPVDGPYAAANSTRSELGGLAAAMVFYGLLLSLWKDQPICKYRWVCDSKAAISNVSKATDKERWISKQPNHSDYIGLIKDTVSSLPEPVEIVWVKGHQIRPIEGETPPRQSDITHNNRVDHLATWYREQKRKPQSKEQTDHVSSCIISISINKQRLVGNVEASIRYHVDGYQLRQYTQAKHQWSNKTWSCIDFEAFGRFYKGLTAHDQDAYTKFMFGHQSVGTTRYKTAKVKDEAQLQCPCCRTAREDPDHLLLCRENPSFAESKEIFTKAMKSSDNHPTLRLLKAGLVAWIQDPMDPFTPDLTGYPQKFTTAITTAINEQQAIGWDQAFRGYLSQEWRQMASEGIYDSDTFHEGRGHQTMKKVYAATSEYETSMWKSRNTVLHDTTTPDLNQVRDIEVAEITDLYAKQDLIGAGDRHYCERPLATILKKKPASRRRWIRYMHRARARYKRLTRHQPPITNFFR